MRASIFARLVRRACYTALRWSNREALVHSDLFVSPYCDRVDWRSGLGDSIHLLYGWARAARPKVIVEIGSARGRSACALALACMQNGQGKVYAIDPHMRNAWTDKETAGETFEFFHKRLYLYNLERWCEVLRATSSEVAASWDRPIDMLFIDGDHSYCGVKHDFDLFINWVKPTGVVVFHDTIWNHYKNDINYRSDIGVPDFLHALRPTGRPMVTAQVFPGLTFLDPTPGGFPLVLDP